MKVNVLLAPVRLPIILGYFYNDLLQSAYSEAEDDTVIDDVYLRQEAKKVVAEILDEAIRQQKPNTEIIDINGHLFFTTEVIFALIHDLDLNTGLRYVGVDFYDDRSLIITFTTEDDHGQL